MNITTDRDRRIHLKKIGLLLENVCSTLDDPERLLFRQSTFPTKVLLQKLKIRLGTIVWRPELFVCRGVECRRLYLCRLREIVNGSRE